MGRVVSGVADRTRAAWEEGRVSGVSSQRAAVVITLPAETTSYRVGGTL